MNSFSNRNRRNSMPGVLLAGCLLWATQPMTLGQENSDAIRIATFNVALNRPASGDLVKELSSGESEPAKKIAEVIQRVRPHVILLNEVDFDELGRSVELLLDRYLKIPQHDQTAINYPHAYTAPVNTGVDSQLDLNADGEKGSAHDAFGYGLFPGQFGMAVLSQFPIDRENVRTFQNFLWKDMPDSLLIGLTEGNDPYYTREIAQVFRLSSKSHWDVPIQINADTRIHLICAHPTPPVFDGPEDRNGRRNHDEIRLLSDYVSDKGNYLYDDEGRQGGLKDSASFIIAGDLNADPHDGDSYPDAMKWLLENERIDQGIVPESEGAVEAAQQSGGVNGRHDGPASHDTGDFDDERVGNLRIDYVLPSRDLTVTAAGVFWPKSKDPGAHLNDASDHHLVWIDIVAGDAGRSKRK